MRIFYDFGPISARIRGEFIFDVHVDLTYNCEVRPTPFFKPGPLGRMLGPGIARNRPKIYERKLLHFLRVNYWRLNVYFRAKLECRVFGAVWPLIWGGFRPQGRLRPIFGPIRH